MTLKSKLIISGKAKLLIISAILILGIIYYITWPEHNPLPPSYDMAIDSCHTIDTILKFLPIN